MESILKRLREIRLTRTRADGRGVAGGVAGGMADKNSRFLRGESIFFFVRESDVPKELVRWLLHWIWIFCENNRIDASLNPRPPDHHARPGCTAMQTGFS